MVVARGLRSVVVGLVQLVHQLHRALPLETNDLIHPPLLSKLGLRQLLERSESLPLRYFVLLIRDRLRKCFLVYEDPRSFIMHSEISHRLATLLSPAGRSAQLNFWFLQLLETLFGHILAHFVTKPVLSFLDELDFEALKHLSLLVALELLIISRQPLMDSRLDFIDDALVEEVDLMDTQVGDGSHDHRSQLRELEAAYLLDLHDLLVE